MSTRQLSSRAVAELRRRYQARQDAEQSLVTYLAGVLDALDVDHERFLSFDDEVGIVELADQDSEVPE